jgi:hypothetical protein
MMPTRPDPDAWKRRAKPDPWRRWLLIKAPVALAALWKYRDSIAFIEWLFARRPRVYRVSGSILAHASVAGHYYMLTGSEVAMRVDRV